MWPATSIDWRTAPVDLSYVNATEAPADKRGFVRALGEKLQFSDGSQARFWGTNIALTPYLTPPKTSWASRPNVFLFWALN